MIYYPYKSSDQIKFKPALSKSLTQNQQIAIKKLYLAINLLKKKFEYKNMGISWMKIQALTKKSIRFFNCIQNIKIKKLNNTFLILKCCNNNKSKINKTKQQYLKYPIILLNRIMNNCMSTIKKQVMLQLLKLQRFNQRKKQKIVQVKQILAKFIFRNVVSSFYRKKSNYQLKIQKKQRKKSIILAFCQSQKRFVMNLLFQKMFDLCISQTIFQKTQQKNRKRQEKQLLNIKRNELIITGKNKISLLKAQLQQNQSFIHKKKQYGKYQSSIIINKKSQEYKKLQKYFNSLNMEIQISKLALQKKKDSLKQRNIGTIQIQKVFQLFSFIKNSQAQYFQFKNLKVKINQILLKKFEQSKQLKCLQNIELQNIVALYENRLNHNKGQVYSVCIEENTILNNILISLIGLQYYRKQNNQQIKNILNNLQETSSNLQLIKRKHNLNTKC